MALRRIRNEMRDLPNGFSEPIGDDLFKWRVLLIGPEDTVYRGGHFHLSFTFPQDYPFKPPKVLFETKIYHFQIHSTGRLLCPPDILHDYWSPALTTTKVLRCIQIILQDVPEQPDWYYGFDEKVKLFHTDRKLHDETARKWVLEHAMPPQQPLIENVKYQYSILEQQVLCTFNVECNAPETLDKFRFEAQCEDQRVEIELKRDNKEYALILPVTLDYGGMITIESSLWSIDNDRKLPFNTQRHDLPLNALTDDEYLLLISGFWRKWCPEKIVLLDVVRLCIEFYDHRFEITMRWKLKNDSGSFIEQRTMRLTEGNDIYLHRLYVYKRKEWIFRKFLISFGMEQVMEDTCAWKRRGVINVVDTTVCGYVLSDFIKAPFPKTIDIQMGFNKIRCFDAEYEMQIRRVAFLKDNSLSFVENRVKKVFRIPEKSEIELVVGENVIQSDEDMNAHLLDDTKVVLSTVRILK